LYIYTPNYQRLTATKDILPHDDGPLLRSIAAGDQQAFRSLVNNHWRRVYGNTLALIKSPEKAQEITQDIFLKVWLMRERLTEVQSFREYIYVVGRNQVLSELRKKLMATSAAPEDILEETLVPDKQMQFKETYGLIMLGISQLTPQQQLIFKMSRLDGLSHVDIAQRLGLSKNTVKGHIVLALNFLRTFIRDQLGPTLIGFPLAPLAIAQIFF